MNTCYLRLQELSQVTHETRIPHGMAVCDLFPLNLLTPVT